MGKAVPSGNGADRSARAPPCCASNHHLRTFAPPSHVCLEILVQNLLGHPNLEAEGQHEVCGSLEAQQCVEQKALYTRRIVADRPRIQPTDQGMELVNL